MSPLEISICLHYHTKSEDIDWIKSGAPIVDETMGSLVKSGLLDYIVNGGFNDLPHYRGNAKLAAFVNMLGNTPLPEMAFIDPRTGGTIESARPHTHE